MGLGWVWGGSGVGLGWVWGESGWMWSKIGIGSNSAIQKAFSNKLHISLSSFSNGQLWPYHINVLVTFLP